MTRICVVDDDVTFTRSLRQRLEKTGRYRVREINHTDRVLEDARAFRPDIILLDHGLPGLHEHGIEPRLGRDKYLSEAPILYLALLADRHEPRGFAFRDRDGRVYLDKPLSLDSLRNCIHYDLPNWNRERRTTG